MKLHAAEAVAEAVTCVETIVEVEEITLTTRESKKSNDGQSIPPGERPKTRSQTTNHTSSLRAKLERTRMATKTMEVKDPLATTPGQAKSLTTLATKSSNGMRMQTTRRMM